MGNVADGMRRRIPSGEYSPQPTTVASDQMPVAPAYAQKSDDNNHP